MEIWLGSSYAWTKANGGLRVAEARHLDEGRRFSRFQQYTYDNKTLLRLLTESIDWTQLDASLYLSYLSCGLWVLDLTLIFALIYKLLNNSSRKASDSSPTLARRPILASCNRPPIPEDFMRDNVMFSD